MNTTTEIQEALRKLEQAKILLEGALSGKVVEPINNPDGDWEPIEVLLRPEEYRLKTVPKRIWVNEYESGYSSIFNSEWEAKESAPPTAIRIAVPFVEVID